MTLKDQVYTQALLLAGQLEDNQGDILNALCIAATASLRARLREGLQAEDCKADFVAAASLYALAELNAVRDGASLEQITAGDLTIRKSSSADPASKALRNQADLVIAPYLKDNFCFLGV
jgi:hypothetical protein